jgi:hypothetical protein
VKPDPRFSPLSTRRRFLAGTLAAGAWSWSRAAETPENQVLVDWDRAVLQAVKAAAHNPCLTARSLAILHQAAHDALASQSGLPTFLRPKGGLSQPSAPPSAAAAAAAYSVASALFPTHQPIFEQLRRRQLESTPEATRRASAEAGTAWASAHLAARADDGASRAVTYVPRKGPGLWQRTPIRFRPPEMPHWPQVRPFALTTSCQFRPGPPPPLASPEYAAGWTEVRDYGGAVSRARTEAETTIAKFWSLFSYTVTPAGHWNQILGDLAVQNNLPVPETARGFALLSTAMADASIAAWDTKYAYEFWRPVHAISRADEDDNPVTSPDPGWKPLLETPPHPEYVSGHSVFSGVGVTILRHVFDRDDLAFSRKSDSASGPQKSFTSLTTAADEMSRSRIYGGIHFRFSTEAGNRLGIDVAGWTRSWMENHLKA